MITNHSAGCLCGRCGTVEQALAVAETRIAELELAHGILGKAFDERCAQFALARRCLEGLKIVSERFRESYSMNCVDAYFAMEAARKAGT